MSFILFMLSVQSLSASPSQSAPFCHSYFSKTDLLQDWNEAEFIAFHTAVATFVRLENKVDSDSLQAKADLQTQLTQFQKRKGYTVQQRLNFSKLFQEHIIKYKHLTRESAELESQRLMAEHHARASHIKKEKLRLKKFEKKLKMQAQLKVILEKYAVATAGEALVKICELPDLPRNRDIPGSLRHIQFLIQAGVNVNYKHKFGLTALTNAAKSGFTEAVIELLKKGADVDIAESSKRTPLLFASNSGHLEIVKLLLQAGAQWNHVDQFGNTAQLFASLQGHLDILKLLMSKDPNLNIKSDVYVKAVFAAVENSNANTAEYLVESGVPLNQRSHGHTLLTFAIFKNSEKIVRLLLNAGIDTHVYTDQRKGPFELAEDNPTIKKILQDHIAAKAGAVNKTPRERP